METTEKRIIKKAVLNDVISYYEKNGDSDFVKKVLVEIWKDFCILYNKKEV